MVYHVEMVDRRLNVGSSDFENLNRSTFYMIRTRRLQCRAYLYLPKMPERHMICMQRRMKQSWTKNVGVKAACIRRIMNAVRVLGLGNGLHVNNDVLHQFLLDISLENVATDIGLIGIYKAGNHQDSKLLLLFGFKPENMNHFIENSAVRRNMLIYDKNGDPAL